MFQELKTVLLKRSLTITVAMLENEQIRVNVVPHVRPEDSKVNDQIKYSHKDEVAAVPETAIKALTTPISITGAAEEIDTKLPDILSKYTESQAGLQDSFDHANSEIAAAVKAIDDRNKNKVKEKAGKKEEKTKAEEPRPKAEEPLPLWWTDKSAVPPGAAQQPASEPAGDATGAQQNLLSTSVEEEVE